MKYIVASCLFFAVLALTNADDFKVRSEEDLLNARKECAEDKKISAELIERYKKFDFPDEDSTRCYIQCILEKFDLFDPKTGFKSTNLNTQLKIVDNETAKAEVEKCADKNEINSDSCTWAFRGFRCFASKNHHLVQTSLKKE